jgi:hypothetical protein
MALWHNPRTSQVYVKKASSYGTTVTLAAGNAVRHAPGLKLAYNPKALVKSPERHTHGALMAMLARRAVANWSLPLRLYPSGVRNTLPESAAILEALFGQAPENITLSTTFSGTPTTTGGTIGSATGLVAEQLCAITTSAGTFIRRVTTAGTSVVWAPALAAAPVAGDAFKGIASWRPSDAEPEDLVVAHYPQSPSTGTPAREMLGAIIDTAVFDFDANSEPMLTVSGPARGFAGSSPSYSPQAQPGGFTTVGAEDAIPSGITGYFNVGDALYEIEKIQITAKTGADLQNSALGTSHPVKARRPGQWEWMVKINAKVSDDTAPWAPLMGGTSVGLMLQIGLTSGSIWALAAPKLQLFGEGDLPDSGNDATWDFQGQLLGTSGHNEVVFGQA